MIALTHKLALPVLALVGLMSIPGCVFQQQQVAEEPPPPPPAPAPAPKVAMSGCRMAFPTGDTATSAILLEKSLPAEASVGAPFDYSIKVTNLTSNSLDNVVVEDSLPATFKVGSSAPSAESAGGRARWSLGTFAPKESKTIKLSGTATGEGTIQTCATVSYTMSLCCSFPVVSPALKLVKTAPEEVTICDNIPIKLVVTNSGTGQARNVKITDTLVNGLAAVDGKTALTFDVGTLGPGQSKEFPMTLKASKTGRYENKATATADGGLQAASATTITTVRQAVLAIDKVCPDKLFTGRQITYSISVTNNGDANAADTVLEDPLPVGTTFVSASDGGRMSGASVVWNLGALAPKASKKVSVTVNPGSMGIVKNTATARATCAQSVSDGCETIVEGIPAVLLEVVDISDPIMIGENETYEIRVTNQGSIADTNIKIVAKLEDTMEYVSAGGATQPTQTGKTVVFAPLPSLPAKGVALWKVTVKAVKPGDVRFGVEMDTDQLDRNVIETEATNFYE